MKVADILKRVGTLEGSEIWIQFREDKQDDGQVAVITEDTTDDAADQIIARAKEYTFIEMNVQGCAVIITGVRAQKREPKPKPKAADPEHKERREQQKQEIKQEVRRLDQAVGKLIEVVTTPVRRKAARAAGQRGKVLQALYNARTAIRRLLTRIFRKEGRGNVGD